MWDAAVRTNESFSFEGENFSCDSTTQITRAEHPPNTHKRHKSGHLPTNAIGQGRTFLPSPVTGWDHVHFYAVGILLVANPIALWSTTRRRPPRGHPLRSHARAVQCLAA